jgi:hypothetical protein
MGVVLALRKGHADEVLTMVDKLRSWALEGKLQGLMFLADVDGMHMTGVSGRYSDDPDGAMDVATSALQTLYVIRFPRKIVSATGTG